MEATAMLMPAKSHPDHPDYASPRPRPTSAAAESASGTQRGLDASSKSDAEVTGNSVPGTNAFTGAEVDSSKGVPASFGARLLQALERLSAPLDHLGWSARRSIKQSGRSELLTLFKMRHGVMPADLEAAIRGQEPEALAFRLAGDPRLLRAVELLALR